MKKTKKTFIFLIVAILFLGIVTFINYIRKGTNDPYTSYRAIAPETILKEEDRIYIYFYKLNCPYCEEIEDDMKWYGKTKSTLYFCNMNNEKDKFKSFNWQKFHEENDIEIGKANSDGKIEFYEGQSKNKYENSKETNAYGKTKKYEIIIADEEYLKTNRKAKKGYVYASLKTPEIDYSTCISANDIIIPYVPTILVIEDGKITEFYYGPEEIKELTSTWE